MKIRRDVANSTPHARPGASASGGSPPLLELQRLAGNKAVTNTVLQRLAGRDEQLTAYHDKVSRRDWPSAALRLNGFSDGDIKKLVRQIPKKQRADLRGAAVVAMPGWSARVTDAIDRVDVEGGRVAQVLDGYEKAVAAGDWARAALLLNGMSTADLKKRIGRLKHDQLVALKEAAVRAMPGWSQRVVGVVDAIDALAGRSGAVFAEFESAVADGKWAVAALAANGLASGDIAARLARLSSDQLRKLREAAVASMAGWSDRVTDAVDTLLDPEQSSSLKGAAASSFSIAAIQQLYNEHRSELGARQLAAFHELDRPLSGKWLHLRWGDVAASAAERVLHPMSIDQKLLGVCGPAAALQANAEANAVEYANFVRHVYGAAEIGGTRVNTVLLRTKPYAAGGGTAMDPCDWMTLSAINDTSNLVRDYEGHPSNRDEAGNAKWDQGGFNPEGGFTGNQKWILRNVHKCVKVEEHTCLAFDQVGAGERVSRYLRQHGRDVVVIIGNDAGFLQNHGKGKGDGHENHWVRLLTPIDFGGGKAKFTVFSWGGPIAVDWPVAQFEKFAYRFVVGARKKSIDIKS